MVNISLMTQSKDLPHMVKQSQKPPWRSIALHSLMLLLLLLLAKVAPLPASTEQTFAQVSSPQVFLVANADCPPDSTDTRCLKATAPDQQRDKLKQLQTGQKRAALAKRIKELASKQEVTVQAFPPQSEFPPQELLEMIKMLYLDCYVLFEQGQETEPLVIKGMIEVRMAQLADGAIDIQLPKIGTSEFEQHIAFCAYWAVEGAVSKDTSLWTEVKKVQIAIYPKSEQPPVAVSGCSHPIEVR